MLTLADIRNHCLKKNDVTEDFPFDLATLAIRVGGRMFVLTDIDGNPLSLNLKCDPGLALYLRSIYADVRPGYHMNKTHWNTVVVDGGIPDDEILRMIDHSYDMVLSKLPKGRQREIKEGRPVK